MPEQIGETPATLLLLLFNICFGIVDVDIIILDGGILVSSNPLLAHNPAVLDGDGAEDAEGVVGAT